MADVLSVMGVYVWGVPRNQEEVLEVLITRQSICKYRFFFAFYLLTENKREGGHRDGETCSPVLRLMKLPPAEGGQGLEPESLLTVTCALHLVHHCLAPSAGR